MDSIAPERLLLAAQAACPLPLDAAAELPEGLPRLQSEFLIADQAQFGTGEAIVITNLRFCGRGPTGWTGYLLRDVGEVAWREDHPVKHPTNFGSAILRALIEGPAKRNENAAVGAVELKLRNGQVITYRSSHARNSAEMVAQLAKSARSLTG